MEDYRLAVVITREENQEEPSPPLEKLVKVPKDKTGRNKLLRKLFKSSFNYEKKIDGEIKISETPRDGFYGDLTVYSHLGTESLLVYYVEV